MVGGVLTFIPGAPANVRVATADVTGDRAPDHVGVTGPGAENALAIIDGSVSKVLLSFPPFEPTFTGGLFVAAADLDGDGKAEVVVSPDRGGGPVAVVYDGARLAAGLTGDAAQVVRFFGIEDPAFRGGARVALGDLNGDGTPDLVVAAGFLGGPRVALFAGDPDRRGGVRLAVTDIDGDGRADLVTGSGEGEPSRIRAYRSPNLLANPTPAADLDLDPFGAVLADGVYVG